MKKTFTLSFTLLLSLVVLAGPQSLLTISSHPKYPVKVFVDNKYYDQKNVSSNEIVFRDLRPGYHNIRIYRQKNHQFGNNIPGNNNQQLLYSETIIVRKGIHVDIIVNRFGKTYMDEQPLRSKNYNEDEDDWDNNNSYKQAMNVAEFNQLKQAISNGMFENTRLAIAKQTIPQHYFTSLQVKELLNLFSFESSKIELAKDAYNYCTNQLHYYVVNDAFKFSSSKEELAAYLDKQP